MSEEARVVFEAMNPFCLKCQHLISEHATEARIPGKTTQLNFRYTCMADKCRCTCIGSFDASGLLPIR